MADRPRPGVHVSERPGGDKRGPRPLGEALEGFLRRSGIGERIEAASVIPEWEQRVGDRIAAVTTPLRVSGGTLFVSVRSSAWLMELKLIERDVLRKVNAGKGTGRIQRIRFVMDDG